MISQPEISFEERSMYVIVLNTILSDDDGEKAEDILLLLSSRRLTLGRNCSGESAARVVKSFSSRDIVPKVFGSDLEDERRSVRLFKLREREVKCGNLAMI